MIDQLVDALAKLRAGIDLDDEEEALEEPDDAD